MTMTLLIQIGVVPALLVVLAGMLILHVGPDRAAKRRFLLFALAVCALLIAAMFVAGQLGHQWAFQVSSLLAPVLTGVLALVLVRIKLLAQLRRGGKALAALLGAVILALLALNWRQPYGMVSATLIGALLLAVGWAVVRASIALGIALSVVTLALLALLCTLPLRDPAIRPPTWLRMPLAMLFYVPPGLAVAVAAALISTGLRLLPKAGNTGQPGTPPIPWWSVVLRFGLAALLLGALAYAILWTSIWDHTSDGMGGLALFMLAAPAAIAAGMLIGVTGTGWRRAAGLAFAVLVPFVMSSTFFLGWTISYHALTEARAARIQRALERYRARSGRFPDALGELVPRDLLWIPGPIILSGRDWCYQAGPDGYRLGTFYREYFGLPLSLRVYASAGSPAPADWACEDELAALKERYDPPLFYEREVAAAPTAETLPTSVIPIPRTPVQPLVRASVLAPGSWSPDGRYYLYGQVGLGGEPVTTLGFVHAGSGDVCLVDKAYAAMSGLGDHHAWLPGGRLLFVSASGEVDLLTPCEAGVEGLTGRYPERFVAVAAYDLASGRVLLEAEASFWILEGESLEVRQIAEVSPNPYQAHWDRHEWQPGGERLAICRLNGRDRTEGSTLYLVAGDTGAVERHLPLEYASDQSAPMIEWLSHDHLLLQGEGVLAVIDLRSDPPGMTHVLDDLFDLDIAYPEEVSSMAWIVDRTAGHYHLAVRVYHPRNQALYLYHSETGAVEVLHPDVHALLFAPDGAWEELSRRGDVPADQDQYELFWVDTPRDPWRLVIEGHVPRNYAHLRARYLPQSSQMVFSSSQGVSLVAIPDGEMHRFWELAGAQGSISTYTVVAPGEESLVAIVERVGLYFIPLPR